MDLAAPFDLAGDPGGELGVVCVHGFTGTPYEMRYLGESLAHAGVAVRGPRLPGHGTTVEALDATRWADWVAAVDDELDAMARRYRHVAVVGQSLGGLLALYAAARRPSLAAVAALATPLWLEGLSGQLARWVTRPHLARVIRRLPKLGGSDVRDRHVRAENPCYPTIPTRALGELLAFMRVVDDALPAITAPVLVLHARRDHTAPVACARRIAERARARRVRILPRSFHLIAVDVERTLVAAEVTGFLRRHTATPGDPPCVT